MKTDDLITALAADTLPRASVGDRLLRALPIAVVLSVAGFFVFWGVRSEIAAALGSATVLKTVLPLLIALFAGALALGLSRPEAQPRGRKVALALLGGALLVGFVLALGVGGTGGLVAALATPSLLICLTSVPALAVPLLVAALWALSAGAPRNPGRTGATAGLAAGGLATALYSFYCDQDAVLFFLPAYATAVVLVALVGGLVGARVLKW